MGKLEIVTEPKVYLVGVQTVPINEDNLPEEVERSLFANPLTAASEGLVETAGRVCYWSFKNPRPGGNKAYIERLLEAGHGSVLEHAVFSFLITGVSRSFTHELVRHRAGWSYSQLSQRFVDESSCAFVEPEIIAEDPELHAIWEAAVEASQVAYRMLSDRLMTKFGHIPDKTLRRKRAREAARSVLPNATETRIFVTVNARALRHFIEMRASEAADVEIHQVALKMLATLQAEAPHIFGDYALDHEGSAETPYRKV